MAQCTRVSERVQDGLRGEKFKAARVATMLRSFQIYVHIHPFEKQRSIDYCARQTAGSSVKRRHR
eukprot:scaffold113980_cov24-Tisochrysis_lutea.AAC.15